MGVAGLWIAMAVGISMEATFYIRLIVFKTDWQLVAEKAERRINSEKAKVGLLDNSLQFGSYRNENSICEEDTCSSQEIDEKKETLLLTNGIEHHNGMHTQSY